MDMNGILQWMSNMDRAVQAANTQARQAIQNLAQSRADIEAMAQQNARQLSELQTLKGLVQGLRVGGAGTASRGAGSNPFQVGRPDMLSIEEIPGRRIPFDLTVQIGVPDNQTSPLTGSYPLSMDGPFVAVARYATFISSYTFQVSDGESSPRFTGRTWGRQRPISSTLDLMDAITGWVDGTVTQDLGGDCDEGPAPTAAVISRAASRSPFRSMGFDGYVEVSSSVYPRQNQQVPTSLWAPGFNQMLQLPVLDYWEKGETVEFKIEPLHQNNPSAGNIQALLGSMPYLAGQYDGHEGIMYPNWECTPGVSDIIARRPAGVLVVGLLGFKILQPPGVRLR